MNEAVLRRLVLGVAVLALFAIALRLAWLGDDAYITLRSVENWVRGNGLRWNAGDRVQTYTHPLWMLVLAAGRAVSGEVYFTTIALSLAIASAASALLVRRAATPAAMAAIALLLAGTRAFGEYATSGLETPLTSLLLVLFVGTVARGEAGVPRFRRAVLLGALLATNRMDLALLVAPAVLATCRVRLATALRVGAIAAAPFLAWFVFATIYYGSPLPVTAHAKAFGTGIPAGELFLQGLRYAAFAVVDDPVLLPTVFAGLAIGLAQRATRWLAFGALLYVGYVVKVGGDFMAGRFFLPPFVVATAILAEWLGARRRVVPFAVAVAAMVLGAVRGVPPWLRSPAADVPPADLDAVIEAQHGIGDERRIYYPQLGLFSPTRAIPEFGALHAMVRPGGAPEPWILLNGAVGSAGFGAGAMGHVLDPILCDPLLTRLPARDPARWRIGHVLRRIPEGYYETLATGENRLLHPGLRAWYGALRTLSRAPVFSRERLAMAWRLLVGEFDAGFRAFLAEDYRHPPRVAVAASSLPPPLPPGTFWFDEPRLHLVYDGGIAVAWPGPQTAGTLRLQAMGLCSFRCRFVRGGQVVGEAVAVPQPQPADLGGLRAIAGLREERVVVPAAAGAFDALWIDAVANAMTHTSTGPPAVGAITFEP